MSDTSGYPVAQQPYDPSAPLAQSYDPRAASVGEAGRTGRSTEVNEQGLTADETAEADLLYEELKPKATETAREYVLARTPASMQEYMITKIEADWPVETPEVLVRVQGEQGRVSVQKPAISDDSPQVARKGQLVDPARRELDTGRDANARRVSP